MTREEAVKTLLDIRTEATEHEHAVCYVTSEDAEAIGMAIEALSAEAVQGEWMLKEHLWECDQCGCRINRANPLKGNIWNYNFCPNCGAKMKGVDHEVD